MPDTPQTLKLDIEDTAGVEDNHKSATRSVPPIVSSSQEPSRPAKVEENDRLKIANLHIMVENCGLQERYFEGEKQKAQKSREEYFAQLIALRNELSVKYGIDFSKAKVRHDGTIEYVAENAGGIPPALAALLRPGG
jgi:hypothetical protein